MQIPAGATPGTYTGQVEIGAAGLEPRSVDVRLDVSGEEIAAAGDDEPWRHSRLRWLDSTIAEDDGVAEPFTPVVVHRTTPDTADATAGTAAVVQVFGREVSIGVDGLPTSIRSFFAPELTHRTDRPRDVIAGPVRLVFESADGREIPVVVGASEVAPRPPGAAEWSSSSTAGPLSVDLDARLEFDGNIDFEVAVTTSEGIDLGDIRLEIPYAADVARYMLGMGRVGGYRPDSLDWKWEVRHNQDGAWMGDVNAGLQFSLRDDRYERPLNTNFYLSKPLVMPASWANDGRGGCRLGEAAGNGSESRAGAPGAAGIYRVVCYSGLRTMQAGEVQRYDFRLAVTPFKTIDPRAQFATRFYHRFEPLEEIAATGANVVNVHHATDVNPWINYPFLSVPEMRAYVDEAHARDMRMKIYYTVRELTNRAPELFALRSLGTEIFSDGPGGGFAWLQEHLGDGYIAGWLVPRIEDAAIVNSGVSRWHNYYLEGLDWLARNMGIDGLYIDDVAFGRTTMQRLRKILDRRRDGALIDLHSANQFNERDGFANSANLYMEHFPYIDRLWFGEYFDYDSPPEYWMTEIAGIPFGLMGEMLQDGGNPWRGMLYGMTARMPWAGDPSPLWELWDAFGIGDARMLGYWVPEPPVRTGRADVLATTYVRDDGQALIALASWAEDTVEVHLEIDGEALGIDTEAGTLEGASGAWLTAPPVESFQPAASFATGEPIPIEPGRGWLLILR